MKLLTLFSLFISFSAICQDYHNWSEHFGTRATLLGGAATAGLGDNGTVYYNAAAMGYADEIATSVTVNAYGMNITKLENALGPGHNLKSTSFVTMPNLIAGILKFQNMPKIRVGYAALTKRFYNNSFDYLHSGQYDIFSSTAGNETFVGSYGWSHSVSEYYGGFGVSWTPAKWVSFGFSHFGIYRAMDYRNSIDLTVLPQDGVFGESASVSSNVSFNYWNVKIMFKPAISFNWEVFKFGIAFTTPTINIMGKANVYRDFNVINMTELLPVDVTVIDRAESIKAVHKEPGALAIGISWNMGKRLWGHFSQEIFFGQKRFYVFNPNQVPNSYPTAITQADQEAAFGEENFMAYSEATYPIMNVGLGFEAQLNEKWKLYTGARTDFLNNRNPYYTFNTLNADATKWHLYHFSLGTGFNHKNGKHYTAGIDFALTPRQRYYRLYDFNTPRTDNALIGDSGTDAFANFYSIKLVVEIMLPSISKEKQSEENRGNM